ncbi:MAG: hypothetical protein K8T90_11380 [Planctomycetes bacterium]|nr:hypothetical protein [Planctomycetota bacterium]
MWWYRDTKTSPAATKPAKSRSRPDAAPPVGDVEAGRGGLGSVVRAAFDGRAKDPDAWLLMSLLVDSRLELDGGATYDGMSVLEAERAMGEAAQGGEPMRLYNRFVRDFGDGYSARTDLPEEHRNALISMREKLSKSSGVKAFGPRTPRATDAAT